MIVHKKQFYTGLVMTIAFVVIFCYMWTPNFHGVNAFVASDNIFNSISKDSCNKLPELASKAESKVGTPLNTTFKVDDAAMAQKTGILFEKSGADVVVKDNEITVKGDLGAITGAAIADSEVMFYNKNDVLAQKYGYDAKEAMYYWWVSFDKMNKTLQKTGDFKGASLVTEIKMKAVELGYNFNGIEAKRAVDEKGLLSFMLLFYLGYTILWGCAILFLCEGFGVMMVGHKSN